MAKRNYAALPHEYLEEMDMLDDAAFGRLCRALLTYSMTGKEIELSGDERFCAKRVFMQEDRFQESYEELAKMRRAAGKAGASARWNGKATAGNSKNGKAIANDDKDGNTETNTDTKTNIPPPHGGNITRVRRFKPPTLAEVQSYVAERHSPVDPQEFIDFYAAKGWMVGKTPMKDWKAACRNAEKWDRWQRNRTAGSLPGTTPHPEADARAKERMERLKRKMQAGGEPLEGNP